MNISGKRILVTGAAGHLGGHIVDLRHGFDVNISGTSNLIEAGVEVGGTRFVFTSSSVVYDGRVWLGKVSESNAYDPASLYGAAKSGGEMFLRVFHGAHGLEYVALRCSTIYGVRQSMRSTTARLIPESFERIDKGLAPVIFGDGSAAYDFVNVLDVARAHVMASKSPVKAASYNVATGDAIPIIEAAKLIAEVAGFDGPLETQEVGSRNNIPTHVLDVAKAERELGFKASISLYQGLEIYRDSRRDPAKRPKFAS